MRFFCPHRTADFGWLPSITAKSHTQKNSRRICLVQPAGVFGKVSQNLLLIDFHLGAVVAHCHDVVGIGGEEDVGVFR